MDLIDKLIAAKVDVRFSPDGEYVVAWLERGDLHGTSGSGTKAAEALAEAVGAGVKAGWLKAEEVAC